MWRDGVIEYRLKHKDGTYRWLLSRDLVYRRDESGQPWQNDGVANDITERKNIEGSRCGAARSGCSSRSRARGPELGMADRRRGFSLVRRPPGDRRSVVGGRGPDPDEAIAMVAAESRLDARQAAGEIVSRGGPFSHDLKLRRADGRVVWLSVAGTIDHDGAGRR